MQDTSSACVTALLSMNSKPRVRVTSAIRDDPELLDDNMYNARSIVAAVVNRTPKDDPILCVKDPESDSDF